MLTVLILFVLLFRQSEQAIMDQVDRQSRTLLQQVMITRAWIADHGGIYVIQGPGIKNIRSLSETAIVDARAGDSVFHTPESVTRVLSGYAEQQGLYRFHITSLKPMSPINAPTPTRNERAPGGSMQKILIAVTLVLIFAINGDAEELPVPDGPAKAAPQADTASLPQDVNNPENALPAEQQESPQNTYFEKKTDRPVSAHKVNYFSVDHWPGDNDAQVKFQISMKFRVLKPNLYVFKYNLFPAYVAYTQKSLWNEGQESMPFEESNYNPEFFLDYPVNTAIMGRFKLRNIVVSPLEHESNGVVGVQSRSWNRQYVLVRFGLEAKEKLEVTNSFLSDKASLYVKLWYAWGYSSQDAYLQSLGDNDKFLDYMGQGEIGVSIRNFLWRGSLRDHQLDVKTPIFRDARKESYEFEFRQQLPNMNFAIYLQYWHGYGETLLRFDQFGRRSFAGFAFSY